jgi:hypothetical protein
MTPRQLCKWADINIPSVTFHYCTAEDHKTKPMTVKQRFKKVQRLPDAQKLIPASENQVQTEVQNSLPLFSFSEPFWSACLSREMIQP